MAQYGNKSSKNPPWARADQGGMGMAANQMQQTMMNANIAAALPNANILPYQQQQMFQGQLGYQQQLYNNLGTVQYPTRALNTAAFQNTSTTPIQNQQNRTNETNKERVITGTVTKLQDNFGFVDNDIFFQLSCVTNGANNLRIGSRVLVEAIYNSSMPFKWNAQRIQVLSLNTNQNQQQRNNYNAVPPPANASGDNRFGGGNRNFGGNNRNQLIQNKKPMQQQMQQNRRQNDRGPQRDRSLSAESDRKRRKNDRRRSASRDRRTRSRSRSPARKKRRPYVPRYSVHVPKHTFNNFEVDMIELKRKFTSLYIPSDFFLSHSTWHESFPIDKPLNLDAPCKFHVLSKDVTPPKKVIPEPADVDYKFCAKVILLASPGLEELFKKCITLSEDSSRSQSRSPEEDTVIPAKLINILMGQRGKEPMAIGGPWSPSMDGEDPESDPGVLIKTAIRSTKYQTGIDLSNCTHWFRFLEIHYMRGDSVVKGRSAGARVETVVLFIPDVWSCVATRPEWTDICHQYGNLLQRHISTFADDSQEKKDDEVEEDKDDESCDIVKKSPTHYSELDPKNMKVSDLRDELEARGLSPKGLKTQLVARLSKAIKSEADAEDQKEEDTIKPSDDELDYDEKPEEELEKEKDEEKQKEEERAFNEREKARLEKLYKLPESPHILVHPNPEFKSGKFNCTVASLHSLLNYRVEDNKEHSFELFLFAEMFNSMLMRDFSMQIYRAVTIAANERIKEEAREEKERKAKEKAREAAKEKEKEKEKEKDKEKEKEKDKENDKDKEDKKTDKDKKTEEIKKKDEEEDKNDTDSEYSRDTKRGEDIKKKEKGEMKTVDPFLLLSFVYFDSTQCGYITDRDLEDILSNLSISLSRAQVKRLVQKVITKDTLPYRRLTDKSTEEINEEQTESTEDAKTIIDQCNRDLLPKFRSSPKSEPEKLNSGFINYNGSLIDVGKLMIQLERNESSMMNTEKLYNRLLEEHNSLKNNHESSLKSVKELTNDVHGLKRRLSTTNNELDVMSARVMRDVDVIFKVKKLIDPIIKENTPEEEPKPVVKNEIKKESKEIGKDTTPSKDDKSSVETEKKDQKKESDDDVIEVIENDEPATESKEEPKPDKSNDMGDKENEEKSEENDMEVEETSVEDKETEGEEKKQNVKTKAEAKRKAAVKEEQECPSTPATPRRRKRN